MERDLEYGVAVGVRALAQMCCFLGSEFYGDDGEDGTGDEEDGDVRETEEIMRMYCETFGDRGAAAAETGKQRKPQTFQDWLLTHSDDEAFERVGLSLDGEWIIYIYNALVKCFEKWLVGFVGFVPDVCIIFIVTPCTMSSCIILKCHTT